jgi:hypothetical protein
MTLGGRFSLALRAPVYSTGSQLFLRGSPAIMN